MLNETFYVSLIIKVNLHYYIYIILLCSCHYIILYYKCVCVVVCVLRGNYENERPYVEGDWCSRCPENLQKCENNLCGTSALFPPLSRLCSNTHTQIQHQTLVIKSHV